MTFVRKRRKIHHAPIRTYIIFVIFVGLCVFFFLGTAVIQKKPLPSESAPSVQPTRQEYVSAKEAYTLAIDRARVFAKDNVLNEIVSVVENQSDTKTNGTSNSWQLHFYSPSQKLNFRIDVVKGQPVNLLLESAPEYTTPFTDEWVDSALIARSKDNACSSLQSTYIFYSLKYAPKLKKTLWFIGCKDETKTNKTVQFDAKLGVFLTQN